MEELTPAPRYDKVYEEGLKHMNEETDDWTGVFIEYKGEIWQWVDGAWIDEDGDEC